MMATTHGFVGLAVAAAVATVSPELAIPAAIGGIAGGITPDLDVLAAHRKTLHFPVYYPLAALLALPVAVTLTSPITVAVALFFTAAALHVLADVIGGIPALRPWAVTNERAVYVHPLDRWVAPRMVIRYDGAPEDFFLGAAFAVPGVAVFSWPIRGIALVGLLISLIYAAFRKPIGRRLAAG